jgi:hypothetical protein
MEIFKQQKFILKNYTIPLYLKKFFIVRLVSSSLEYSTWMFIKCAIAIDVKITVYSNLLLIVICKSVFI